MEACGETHYWMCLLSKCGHQVKLMAPQFVKPFVKYNKNDAIDTETICEVVQRPNMRFVAIKNTQQQDVLSIHRLHSLVVSQRTALINQIRGLLQVFGIVFPEGKQKVNNYLPSILEDAENSLSGLFWETLHGLYQDLAHFDQRVGYDNKIDQITQADEQAKKLITIPGVGSKVETAFSRAIGDISAFKNSRDLATWLGLVPRQCSIGGKSTLLGISKREMFTLEYH
jgi:transposase